MREAYRPSETKTSPARAMRLNGAGRAAGSLTTLMAAGPARRDPVRTRAGTARAMSFFMVRRPPRTGMTGPSIAKPPGCVKPRSRMVVEDRDFVGLADETVVEETEELHELVLEEAVLLRGDHVGLGLPERDRDAFADLAVDQEIGPPVPGLAAAARDDVLGEKPGRFVDPLGLDLHSQQARMHGSPPDRTWDPFKDIVGRGSPRVK